MYGCDRCTKDYYILLLPLIPLQLIIVMVYIRSAFLLCFLMHHIYFWNSEERISNWFIFLQGVVYYYILCSVGPFKKTAFLHEREETQITSLSRRFCFFRRRTMLGFMPLHLMFLLFPWVKICTWIIIRSIYFLLEIEFSLRNPF
jgi:hypothetical protein